MSFWCPICDDEHYPCGPVVSPEPEPEYTEWMIHLDVHMTEHDLRHAGMALRSGWPPVKRYIWSLQKRVKALEEQLRSVPKVAARPNHGGSSD